MTRNCLNLLRKSAGDDYKNIDSGEFLRRWMDEVRDPWDKDPHKGSSDDQSTAESRYIETRMNNMDNKYQPRLSHDALTAVQDKDMDDYEKDEALKNALMYGAGGAAVGGGLGGLLFKKNRVLGALGGSVIGAGAGYGAHRIMNYLKSRQNA